MKFITREAAEAEMVANLMSLSIFAPEDVLAKVTEIAGTIPPATKMGYAPAELQEDVYVLAANYYDTYQNKAGVLANANNEGIQLQGSKTLQTQVKAEIQPTLSDESSAAVQRLLASNIDQKAAKTSATKIKALLVRAPKPSELYKGIMLEVKDENGLMEKYKPILTEKAGNKEAFAKVAEMIAKGTKAPVFCNDASRKYVGVTVSTPVSTEGKTVQTDVSLTAEGLEGFLALEVLCRIPSDNDLGVRLTGLKAKQTKGRRADTSKATGVPQLKWDGKTAVIKAGDANRVVAISEIQKNEFRKGSLPVDVAFEVFKGTYDASGTFIPALNKKGEKITKIVRMKGTSDKIPMLQRKSVYSALFGEEKHGTAIYGSLTAQERVEALNIATKFVDAMGAADPGASQLYGAEMADILKAISAPVQAHVESFA